MYKETKFENLKGHLDKHFASNSRNSINSRYKDMSLVVWLNGHLNNADTTWVNVVTDVKATDPLLGKQHFSVRYDSFDMLPEMLDDYRKRVIKEVLKDIQ